MDELIQSRLETLPTGPGCYLFRDKKSQIIYVGKARNLRARVRQYFQENSSDYRYFVPLLAKVLGDIETLVTANEIEALILESALIKEHKPRYNVRLRDDKSYLSIRLNARAQWPRLEIVRRPSADRSQYYGPYPSATAVRRTLKVVNKHFKLRTCDDRMFASRTRPCLEFQIKRCPAPCVLEIDAEAYTQQVKFVGLFLEGRSSDLQKSLEDEMRNAALVQNFERAAVLRDQLQAVRELHERQRVAVVSDTDIDVVGLYREGDAVALALMVVRAGVVRDTQVTLLSKTELPDDEIVDAFLSHRYGVGGHESQTISLIPDEIVVPVQPQTCDALAEWLTLQRGRAVEVVVPKAGAKARLLAMANENAQHRFRERRVQEKSATDHSEALQQRLGLPHPPRVIECVDISHHGGSDTVAAIVCLENGVPNKARYRGYHLETVSDGDDYKAMLEVIRRRFARAKAKEVGWEAPDLFVVDGGRGQLAVAVAVLEELAVEGLAICALAKERETSAGDKMVDRVYLPGVKNPVIIDRHQAALVLLSRARDEAHRFANVTREKLHHKRTLTSELDRLQGVGPKTRAALLKRFGSVKGVREASLDELERVDGMTSARARVIFDQLRTEGT
ncbi:MAG: excinuclease ABC subunit UvrC [Deltaproteobacteria bacterium]|nr:excinuclease ABC subunit UvrC [Deltaproteobacteria bacterium]